jgi:hypothetical protein
MRRLLTRRSTLAVTLIVALATLCALVLPEGNGGRDSVVRLTRAGLQRLDCADAAWHDHDDPESFVESSSEPKPDPTTRTGSPLLALVPGLVMLPVVHAGQTDGRAALPPWAAPPPGRRPAGRAPPVL